MFAANAQEVAPATDPATIDRIAAAGSDTVDEAVRLDPAFFLSKIESWVVGFQQLLPNIIVALILFAIVVGVAWAVGRAFQSWAARRSNLGVVLGSFIRWTILLFGLPRRALEAPAEAAANRKPS